jgi:hypothetical protein
VNNEQLLTQAEQYCSYSATHAETPELAAFYNELRSLFLQALSDFRNGKNNPYRSALISAATFLHADITSNPDPQLPTDLEPDSE